MRDVSAKSTTLRTASAQATLSLASSTIDLIKQGRIPKGDPFEVARVAATMAAKNTAGIIPYCHSLPVDFVGIDFATGADSITVTATVKAVYKTGVEMEALTAVSVAALTLYDMLKMLDETMEITGVRLASKKGGKSDFRDSYDQNLRAAVLVMSDSIAAGEKDDTSGRTIVDRLRAEGFDVEDYRVVPDNVDVIRRTLHMYADEMKLQLVLTTGGTGFCPRDNTPEVMDMIVDRDIPGIPEALRAYGQERTPYSMLSRGKAGIRKSTVIVNLPGSLKGVEQSLDALFPGLMHSFRMLWGSGHTNPTRNKEAAAP